MTRTLPLLLICGVLAFALAPTSRPTVAQEPKAKGDDFTAAVKPVVAKYCLSCHSTKVKKGSLDLERFGTVADVRKDVKVWQNMIEQIETGEMPPKDKPQPSEAEKKQLIAWIKGFLEAEAKARTGDPGFVPLRRLSNAEYDYTVRDLTGVDLRPAREFPADGAAGEGFTNAAEALTDISPALFTKYLNAAKDTADRAVLLPDGFRFSPAKTRRDWTDEGTAKLRAFYREVAPPDGKLPVQAYLLATVRNRDALLAGKFDEVAAKEKLSAKYLRALFAALSNPTQSRPLDTIRAKWRGAKEADVPALAADVVAQQNALWRTVRIGSYVQAKWGEAKGGYLESVTRQVPVDPPVAESATLRFPFKPAPGQSDVTLYMSAHEVKSAGDVVWARPRFEGAGKPPLLLSDYATFGLAFEVEYPTAFANSAKYLAAAVELANDKKLTVEDVARTHGIDAAFLKRWSEVLAVESFARDANAIGRIVPAVELTLLEVKTAPNAARPAINGWHKKGTDLPVLVTNSSDKAEQIPGRVPAKGVGVHPMPKEFVAVVWTAPVACSVKVSAKIVHAHPACGNGVAYWLEHRRAGRAAVFAEGGIDLGGEAVPAVKTLKIEKGDQVILAVDAKNNEHTCDMTAIEFALTDTEKPGRIWNLAADIATSVQAGNPHDDAQGNKAVWSFVRGPSRPLGASVSNLIPPASLLGKWRDAASDPKQKDEAAKLASQVQALLSGARPKEDKSPDRALYDNLVGVESKLFVGVDVAKVARAQTASKFGLPKERFVDGNLTAKTNQVIEVKLPAALFVGREFVVEAKLGGAAGTRLVLPGVSAAPGAAPTSPLLGSATGEAYKQFVAGNDEFRRVFPLYTCFPQVVPTDEVVSLKMFHREDEPLVRLFLSDEQTRTLERLWAEHRFVSRQPVAEWEYLPQFMGYTTQDTPKELQQFFIDRKPLFKKLADEFVKDEEVAAPKQLDTLVAFAEKVYRRPLAAGEKDELRALYTRIRAKGAPHEEAFRGVLARVFVAPAFLYRIEAAPKGKEPGAVSDYELATRLSYFLWASAPDDELRALAVAGKLRDPQTLAAQARRMTKDAKTRALAVEFGTQWLHVRAFDEHNEKNEKLFPTFTPELRKAMNEESVLFFLDLFQSDRPVTAILDSDHTFVNEALAKHYGIPGVSGPAFRKVDGVKKHGRGGILGLGSVQAKQSGASRTSPVLRGNWVVETLLGEKLPKPPANVPQLPEIEGADKLTVRQLVERHAKDQACAVCHVRIDPFGFALEKYDPIGRLREKDLGGLAIDAKSKLKDGTEFDGIDGLRTYLLTKKKDVIVRLFCQRLLGYALGRSTTLSDTALIDEMVSALNKNEGKVSAAVEVLVTSKQFRMVRGSGFEE
ncbi:MAG: DUF1592 domain-containing protein [Planctomycetes bacterium]|nr:DUF1592 domain-containing protein [Planctomycetota bacterium]